MPRTTGEASLSPEISGFFSGTRLRPGKTLPAPDEGEGACTPYATLRVSGCGRRKITACCLCLEGDMLVIYRFRRPFMKIDIRSARPEIIWEKNFVPLSAYPRYFEIQRFPALADDINGLKKGKCPLCAIGGGRLCNAAVLEGGGFFLELFQFFLFLVFDGKLRLVAFFLALVLVFAHGHVSFLVQIWPDYIIKTRIGKAPWLRWPEQIKQK
jgi:hypothetical protein